MLQLHPQFFIIFGDVKLLALDKSSSGIRPTIMVEAFYWLVSRILQKFFFYLSSHHFNMAVRGGCEAVVHGI